MLGIEPRSPASKAYALPAVLLLWLLDADPVLMGLVDKGFVELFFDDLICFRILFNWTN